MVQVLENPNPSIAGRLGKGIAQGLSEQLPKELERGRLSYGLKNLKSQAEEGASPIDLATSLLTIPGVTPEMAQYIQPYLQSAAIQSQKSTPSGEISQDQSEKNQSFRRLGTEEAIQNRATELGISKPLIYPTRDSQVAAADREYKNQQQSISNIRDAFTKSFEKKIQGHGDTTFSSVLGDLQEDYINKAEEDVLKGNISEKEAINRYTKEALRFAKNKAKLDALGFSNLISPSDTLTSLKEAREDYKKVDKLEEFKDEIKSKFDLTDQNASSLAFPIANNKNFSSFLKSVKPKSYPKSDVTADREKATTTEEIVENISKYITDDDSIFSILKELENKNYDPEEIKKAIQSDKKIRLNDRQRTELKSRAFQRPSLGDLFLFEFIGKNP